MRPTILTNGSESRTLRHDHRRLREPFPLTFRLSQHRQPVEAVGGRRVPGAARRSRDVEGSLVQRLRLRELPLREGRPR